MVRALIAALLACACTPDEPPVDDSDTGPVVETDVHRPASACPRRRGALRDCWGVTGLETGPRASPWLPAQVEQHLTPGDVDGDGLPDLVATEFFGPTRLWRNLGGFRFEDVTAAWGLEVAGAWGADLADLDRDGDLDLVVTSPDLPGTARRWIGGETPDATLVVLENIGGAFVDRTAAWGFGPIPCALRCNVVGVALSDLNLDGVLDLVPINHVSEQQAVTAFVSDGAGRWARDDRIFEAVVGELYGATFVDLDGDDRLDFLPVVNNNVSETSWPRVLFRGERRFVERVVGSAFFGDAPEISAFTAASVADFDQDGDPDVALADYRMVLVLRNRGDGTFDDVVLAEDRPSQGIAWFDHDGDGWDDLWVFVGVNEREPVPRGAHRMWRNDRGALVEAAPPFFEPDLAAVVGVAVSDLDRDGRPDLVLGGSDARPRVLRNGFDGRWLSVALVGEASPPHGLGARVEVEAGGVVAARTMRDDGNPGSTSEAVLHFGLGEADIAERVTVRWPSGLVEMWTALGPGRHVLVEGTGG